MRNYIAKTYINSRATPAKRRVLLPSESSQPISTPETNSLDAIAQALIHLDESELEEVQDMVKVLLEASRLCKYNTEQLAERQVQQLESSSSPGGHIELKMIPDKGRQKTYGPYRYLRYWHGGRLKSRYLGKA